MPFLVIGWSWPRRRTYSPTPRRRFSLGTPPGVAARRTVSWPLPGWARRFPELRRLWIDGLVSTEHLSVIATPTHCLTDSQMTTLLDILTPRLPRLSVRATRIAVRHALDLLRPQDAKHAEQHDWDRRGISYSSHGGMVLIAADLPQVEGETLITVLNSLGESLRVEGDGLTDAQRRADALITLVDRAASHEDLPATTNGLPVATTITVGLPEAERVAEGGGRRPRPPEPTSSPPRPIGGRWRRAAAAPPPSATLPCDSPCAPENSPGCSSMTDDRPEGSGLLSERHSFCPWLWGDRCGWRAPPNGGRWRSGTGCLLCHAPATQCQTHHVRPWSDGGRTECPQPGAVVLDPSPGRRPEPD